MQSVVRLKAHVPSDVAVRVRDLVVSKHPRRIYSARVLCNLLDQGLVFSYPLYNTLRHAPTFLHPILHRITEPSRWNTPIIRFEKHICKEWAQRFSKGYGVTFSYMVSWGFISVLMAEGIRIENLQGARVIREIGDMIMYITHTSPKVLRSTSVATYLAVLGRTTFTLDDILREVRNITGEHSEQDVINIITRLELKGVIEGVDATYSVRSQEALWSLLQEAIVRAYG